MKIRARAAIAAALALAASLAVAQDDPRRFRLLPFTEMTPAQKAYADAVMSGPTSSTGSAAVVPGAGRAATTSATSAVIRFSVD